VKRAEILDTAKQYVTKDRNASYGEPENAFQTIAQFWNVYLGARRNPKNLITAYDVGVMMLLMKTARMAQMPKNADSAIDAAGYAACAGEILAKYDTDKANEST